MRNCGDIDVAEGKANVTGEAPTAARRAHNTCYLRCLRASCMMSRAIQMPRKNATM